MAKYEFIDLDRADQNKPIQITMPFSEMRHTIRSLTKWQGIQFVFGILPISYGGDNTPEHEHKCKFYRTLENKGRLHLEKILLSKIYLDGTITRT